MGRGWPEIIAFEPKRTSDYSTIIPLFYFTEKKTKHKEAVWSFSKFAVGPWHSKTPHQTFFILYTLYYAAHLLPASEKP